MSIPVLVLIAGALLTCSHHTLSLRVIISNATPRLDSDGLVVNAHNGNTVLVNGTYFLYGENYGSGNYVVSGNVPLPKLVVYTSRDLVTWTFGGFLHNNTSPAWAESGLWKFAPNGTWWSPSAVWSEKRSKMILWWSATTGECCDATFGVAESSDGVHFDLVTLEGTPGSGASVDGSSLLIDDDGRGYVAFTAMNPEGQRDHVYSIEALSSDYLSSTGIQVAPYFPDFFVEGGMLFKRHNVYYVVYGSCCCACREGSGAVVFMSGNISGPWKRQGNDSNCNFSAEVCAGMDPHPYDPDLKRPLGHLIVPAQGTGISVLPSNTTDAVYLWSGSRWLSAPYNPAACNTLCSPAEGACVQDARYSKGDDFDYWIPLSFDDEGNVRRFEPFVNEFELDLPDP